MWWCCQPYHYHEPTDRNTGIDRNFGNYGDLPGVITIHEQNIEVQQQLDFKKKEKVGAEAAGKQFKKDLEDKTAARDATVAQFQKMCWSQTAQIREAFKEALKTITLN